MRMGIVSSSRPAIVEDRPCPNTSVRSYFNFARERLSATWPRPSRIHLPLSDGIEQDSSQK